MADRLTTSAEHWELKEDTLRKQIPLSMEEPAKIAHIGNTLDLK
jgi:hypothetical protein